MKKTYSNSETLATMAQGLIKSDHAELLTARIQYVFVGGGLGKQAGKPLAGKVQKLSGYFQHELELDFIIFLDETIWADLAPEKREALLDYYLEHCFGEDDDETGDMKWILRKPEVQEFASILKRRGVWRDELLDFVSIAQELDIGRLMQEETGEQDVDLMN